MAARVSVRAAAISVVLGVHLHGGLVADPDRLQRRPGDLVLALVVVGQLPVEVLPGDPELLGASPSPARNVVSAPSKRSRSRRIAPWMTLFMLIVAMNLIVGAVPASRRRPPRCVLKWHSARGDSAPLSELPEPDPPHGVVVVLAEDEGGA